MELGSINIIYMFSNAGLMVQFVLLLLLFFSITSWAIIMVKYRYLKQAYRESAIFTDLFWKSRSLSDAFVRSKQCHASPIARAFRVGYMELKKLNLAKKRTVSQDVEEIGFSGINNVSRALRRAGNTEIMKLSQMVPFLATTGNTAPFIGLFGTVWGIMGSFHSISLSGSASLATVAPGISEALIATAVGLAVAIPSVIAYNYFLNKIRIIESELQSFSADLLNIIERDIFKLKGND